MQVAGLHTATGATSGLSKLIAEVPDGAPYFTTRAGDGLSHVGPAEAARWVVHCQAFDPSGIKSGAVGDPRVKGGKGYPIGVGWCGNLGLVIAEGRDLAETLLLNLVLDHPSTAEDVPVWEREEPLTAAVDPVLATRGRSHGPVELLVWQSRRIRLIPRDDGNVVDALVWDVDDALAEWHRTASHILRREGEGLVVVAGEKAWRGREVSTSKGARFIDSAVAEAWFRAALRKTLDRAHPATTSTTETTASDTGETA